MNAHTFKYLHRCRDNANVSPITFTFYNYYYLTLRMPYFYIIEHFKFTKHINYYILFFRFTLTTQTLYCFITFTIPSFKFHLSLQWQSILFTYFSSTLTALLIQLSPTLTLILDSLLSNTHFKTAVVISLIYQSIMSHCAHLHCLIIFSIWRHLYFLNKIFHIYLLRKFWDSSKFIFFAKKLLCGCSFLDFTTTILCQSIDFS